MWRKLVWALVTFTALMGNCLLADAQQGTAELQDTNGLRFPFNSLKPAAQFKVASNADWVAIGEDSVWVAGKDPNTLLRIDPGTNAIVAKFNLHGDACSGLALGFGSVWVPLCGQTNSLLRVDIATNRFTILSHGPARGEAGIAVSDDSVWLVRDDVGTLIRIDPTTNVVRQRVSLPPGSYNPIYSSGRIWVTGVKSNLLTVVDARTGAVVATIPVGREPRFLTAGGGSVWTLNQADGTITRIDERSLKVVATIDAKIPGQGGDIAYGNGSVWATRFGTPLTRIDARSNKILRQWIGSGGDSLRFGHGSIWLTDYRNGLLLRIPLEEVSRGSE